MHDAHGPGAGVGRVTRQYDGWCDLLMSADLSGHPVDVAFCGLRLEGSEVEHTAMLDTGAHWSVLPHDVAEELGVSLEGRELQTYSTRHGPVRGVLVTHSVRVGAREGDGIDVEATWFVSDDWPDPPPLIVGWNGFLERIAFGCDPGGAADDEPKFFFAEL